MYDDNQEFLSILYGDYDYDYYDDYSAKQCKKYNQLFTSNPNESFIINKRALPITLNQTQLDDPTSITSSTIKKFIFWENCNTLKDIALSPFDIEVFNAICSLTVAFNKYISPGMIFRVLNGKNYKQGSSIQMRDEIIHSLDKLMNTSIILNENNKRCQLIHAIRIDNIHLNGQPVQGCIKLHEVPAILVAARNRRELDCVNAELLDTPLHNTAENIAIKGYLFRSIKAVKNLQHRKKCFDMRFEFLYTYLDISAPNQNALNVKKLQIRKKVKTLLDYWKTYKVGNNFFIKDYQEVKESNIVTKFAITC